MREPVGRMKIIQRETYEKSPLSARAQVQDDHRGHREKPEGHGGELLLGLVKRKKTEA
jgi:hypothetical protein